MRDHHLSLGFSDRVAGSRIETSSLSQSPLRPSSQRITSGCCRCQVFCVRALGVARERDLNLGVGTVRAAYDHSRPVRFTTTSVYLASRLSLKPAIACLLMDVTHR